MRKWFRGLRYWMIKFLVGNMPVMANLEISNWDFYQNLGNAKDNKLNHMFFGNKVYLLEKRIHEQVFTGNSGKVKRQGNMFVLEEV
jgi:hypothetical protein